jgi:two-component system sensor histidine kinase BarA
MQEHDNKAPIIDWAHQAKEETDDPIGLAKELLSMFVEQVPALQSAIKAAIKNKDRLALEEVLHRFQGACAYCGLARLRDTIAEVTNMLKEDTKSKISLKLLEPIDKETTSAMKELKKIGVVPSKVKPKASPRGAN